MLVTLYFEPTQYSGVSSSGAIVSRVLNHRNLCTTVQYLSWKLDADPDAAVLAL